MRLMRTWRSARAAETLQQVVAAVNGLPEVERAATSWPSVFYTRGGWSTELGDRFRTFTVGHMLSDETRDVLGITVVAGRWFSRDDDGAALQPILINKRLARELFGDMSPLNRELPPGEDNLRPQRVIGIVEDFRHEGELSFPGNVALFRLSSTAGAASALPNALLVRTRPGTPAQFEERLARALEAAARDWTFDIRSMDTRRQEAFQKTLAPIGIVAILAIFVLLMVALGLTGVVWQSVTTRVQEFGLRRAKGATAAAIQRQVITELFVLATAAVSIGATIAVQFPPLALLAPPRVKFLSVAASVTVIYLLTLLCAWYPSRLATRIQPADALHYE